MSYITIDLRLAYSPITRPRLIDQLRHALVHDGFFIVTNYQDYLNPEIVAQMSEYELKFFNMPSIAKDRLNIAKSRHFRGYYNNKDETSNKSSSNNSLDDCEPIDNSKRVKLQDTFPVLKPISDNDVFSSPPPANNHFDEEVIFGIDTLPINHLLPSIKRAAPTNTFFDDGPSEMTAVEEPVSEADIYGTLRGPNQWPSNTSLPGFKSAMKEYISSMSKFAYYVLDELVAEAIGSQTKGTFEYLFNSDKTRDVHRVKFSKRVNKNTVDKESSVIVVDDDEQEEDEYTQISSTFGSETGSVLTFLSLHTSSTNETIDTPLVASKFDGSTISLSQIPKNSFVVISSRHLQALTNNICIPATVKISQNNYSQTTPLYISTFSQMISVDFSLGNFKLPRSVTARARSIERERQQLSQASSTLTRMSIEPSINELFHKFGMSVFLSIARKHPITTASWYPKLARRIIPSSVLTALDSLVTPGLITGHISSFSVATREASKPTRESPAKIKLEDTLKHLHACLVSVDTSIMLHSISSTAPITLQLLKPRVAQHSKIHLSLDMLQQINTIWPQAYYLGVSKADGRSTTIQFGSSVLDIQKYLQEERDETTKKSSPDPPKSPQKRKQVFQQKCNEWLLTEFPDSSASISKSGLSTIPLAPLNEVPPNITRFDWLNGYEEQLEEDEGDATDNDDEDDKKPVELTTFIKPTKAVSFTEPPGSPTKRDSPMKRKALGLPQRVLNGGNNMRSFSGSMIIASPSSSLSGVPRMGSFEEHLEPATVTELAVPSSPERPTRASRQSSISRGNSPSRSPTRSPIRASVASLLQSPNRTTCLHPPILSSSIQSVPGTPRSKNRAAAAEPLMLSPSGASLLARIKAKEEQTKRHIAGQLDLAFPPLSPTKDRGNGVGLGMPQLAAPMTTPRKRRRDNDDPFGSPARSDATRSTSLGSVLENDDEITESSDEETMSFKLHQRDPRYYAYLLSKLPLISSIVIGLRRGPAPVSVTSLEQTVKVIVDSIRVSGYGQGTSFMGFNGGVGNSYASSYKSGAPMDVQETEDSVRLLAEKVPSLLSLRSSGKVTSVRIYSSVGVDEVRRVVEREMYGRSASDSESSSEGVSDEAGEDNDGTYRSPSKRRKLRHKPKTPADKYHDKPLPTEEESPLITPPSTPSRRAGQNAGTPTRPGTVAAIGRNGISFTPALQHQGHRADTDTAREYARKMCMSVPARHQTSSHTQPLHRPKRALKASGKDMLGARADSILKNNKPDDIISESLDDVQKRREAEEVFGSGGARRMKTGTAMEDAFPAL